jgi:hypothetical protein
LRLRAERGDPPGRSARSPMFRLCRELVEHFLSTKAAA